MPKLSGNHSTPAWASTTGTDSYSDWADLPLPGGVTMRMRWCDAGNYNRGAAEGEVPESDAKEKPKHKVQLTTGFWLSETVVTQAQWRAVMGSNPVGLVTIADTQPVVMISWNDCASFVAALNSTITGLTTARFPTDAEWEYACRAGSDKAYSNNADCTQPKGDDPALDLIGWYTKNSGTALETNRTSKAVKGLAPNTWGFYDMLGNVFEWVADWYGDYDSTDKKDPTGPATGEYKTIRGGCFTESADMCRCAYRGYWWTTTKLITIGFRLAVTS